MIVKESKNLKGYSEPMRRKAYLIRARVLTGYPWGCPDGMAQRSRNALLSITSPMFFIKYESRLIGGDINPCLSEYSDDNASRRSRFAQERG